MFKIFDIPKRDFKIINGQDFDGLLETVFIEFCACFQKGNNVILVEPWARFYNRNLSIPRQDRALRKTRKNKLFQLERIAISVGTGGSGPLQNHPDFSCFLSIPSNRGVRC